MIATFFNFDRLAAVSTVLIIFISLIVLVYSKNYLRGDKRRKNFYFTLILLLISLIITFAADNIFLICTSWVTSNFLLVVIMIHKKSWDQARRSGIIALKNFTLGFFCLTLALAILYFETKSFSIKEILANDLISHKSLVIAMSLIVVAALTQSALYPFHNWLISSLNSPTPVSAIMHAGLVNGGGIILARFAPLFFKVSDIMTIIFIFGIVSAVIGTLWKLIQSNVKAMLACSTMSQMGFMMAQCGMGLFPAAIAHLFWHGMFKSYLFLSSPSSWQEKRLDLFYPPKILSFTISLVCGFIGSVIFAKITQVELQKFDTTLILVAISFIGASQVALTIIGNFLFKNFIPALIFSAFLSALYGASLLMIEEIMPPEIFNPQHLNIWHFIGILVLSFMWLARIFWQNSSKSTKQFFLKIYVKILNASQAKSETITSNRNQYNYR